MPVLACLQWTDLLSLRVIYEYKLPQAVHRDGSTTYHEISSKSGLPEALVRRFMRHAMGNHIFAEVPPDAVRHTAASRLMNTDPGFFDTIGLQTSELSPAATKVIEAIKRYGDSGEQNQSPSVWRMDSPCPFSKFWVSTRSVRGGLVLACVFLPKARVLI